MSSPYGSDDAALKSQRYYLIQTRAMTAAVDKPIWTGEISQRTTLQWRATSKQWLLREEESVFCNEEPQEVTQF